MTLGQADQIITLFNRFMPAGAAWLDNPTLATEPGHDTAFGVQFDFAGIPVTDFGMAQFFYMKKAGELIGR